jgi:hypothetical protein
VLGQTVLGQTVLGQTVLGQTVLGQAGMSSNRDHNVIWILGRYLLTEATGNRTIQSD